MNDAHSSFPEPVPAATQLALLPFVAAIDGYLRANGDVRGLRITMHRAMTTQGQEYLQQACAYLQNGSGDWQGKVGRTFAVDTGIMGAAFRTGQIWRTRRMADEAWFEANSAESSTRSWLSIPLFGPARHPVLILFAECDVLNFFADDQRLGDIVAMCNGFCSLVDWLQVQPFENLRNFPLESGAPVTGAEGPFDCQEAIVEISPPQFLKVPSFNFEASAG